MEVYKLSLPNGIVHNIVDYALGEEDVCRTCQEWRDTQAIIRSALRIQRRNNRNVEDAILIFLNVYPPYDYVKQFLKISNKRSEMIDHMLWMLLYRRREGLDVKEDINSYIESKKFNVKNAVRDITII